MRRSVKFHEDWVPGLPASRLQAAPAPDSLPAVPGDELFLAPPPDRSLVSDRTLDQVIRLTGKQSSDPAVSARIKEMAGKTWRDCKGCSPFSLYFLVKSPRSDWSNPLGQ